MRWPELGQALPGVLARRPVEMADHRMRRCRRAEIDPGAGPHCGTGASPGGSADERRSPAAGLRDWAHRPRSRCAGGGGGIGLGDRGDQRPRIGMRRPGVERGGLRRLHDLAAEIHDRDAVADVLHDARSWEMKT